MRGVRFSNIRALGIFPEDELKGISGNEAYQSWSSPQRRRRTPLRLREDPQLYFADILRQSVDNDIRYKQTPKQQQAYKQILDDLVEQRKKAIKDDIKNNLEYERKMQKLDGPWGKPGPGGKIWRNPRDIGLNFTKSMGWTDNDLFSKIKGDHRIRKRTLFTLPDLQNGDECKDIITTKKKEDKDLDKLPNIKPNRTEYCANYCDKNEHQNNVKYKSKNATSTQSKKQKFVKRLSNGERLIKKFPEEINSNGENLDEKKLTPEATILRLTGGVELVPLLARRRRVGARTLPSSDVTRPPEQSCLWRDMFNDDYLKTLQQQIRVKYQQKEEKRVDSAENNRRHQETWASLWGRPGHGAPQPRGRYARSNLAQLLYVPIANDIKT
ncbi:uncharacterized protein LOC126967326 [Leptidea sinapis]|uniref:uncharacterized protein LOC126967326 n=1 Tax=Leptidea sinapis TaxID=189913 RepID=UPI0021241819|nr:uncharacterized protein LOC126967326 [Leptidea sinapis]